MGNGLIARRYADAFYSFIKQSNGSIDKVYEELASLSKLVEESSDFANIIKNPTITHEEKSNVFKTLNTSNKISQELLQFILILIEKKRLNLLVEIEKSIKSIMLLTENKLEAEAVFAEEPSDSIKEEIIKKLEKLTGKKVILKDSVNKDLIGGVKVKFGSQLYDGSVRGQLDKLKTSLM